MVPLSGYVVASPNEITEATGVFAEVSQDRYLVGPRSVVVLVAR